MKNIYNKILKTNNANKKIKILISLVLLALVLSIVKYNSYSYYITSSDNALAIGGSAFISSADINLKIYLEDRNANGNGIGTYSREYIVPTAYYTYNSGKTACTKGITVESFANGKFIIRSENKGWCKVYFDAVDGKIADTNINLYVEKTQGQKDYVEVGRIPDDMNTYVLDTTNTKCTGEGAESASVTLNNKEIYISTSGDVRCEVYANISTVGTAYSSLASVINGLIGTDLISSQDGSVYRVASENGLRYEGKDPDNYIQFNGELWRIVFAVSETGNIKIVRDYVTAATSDTITNSDYANSNINKYLNNTYLYSMNSVAQTKLLDSTWKLGAVSTNAQTVDAIYTEENGSTKGYNASSTSITARVGLVSLSDYGYASYGGNCDRTVLLSNYGNGCHLYNWLYSGTYLTLMGVLSTANYTWRVQTDGTTVIEQWPNDPSQRTYKPAGYLSSSTVVIGGTGSRQNPYRIK